MSSPLEWKDQKVTSGKEKAKMESCHAILPFHAATGAREKDVFNQMWLCHQSQVAQDKWERSIPAANLEENLAGKLQGTVGV
jgi:hypothetical protein